MKVREDRDIRNDKQDRMNRKAKEDINVRKDKEDR